MDGFERRHLTRLRPVEGMLADIFDKGIARLPHRIRGNGILHQRKLMRSRKIRLPFSDRLGAGRDGIGGIGVIVQSEGIDDPGAVEIEHALALCEQREIAARADVFRCNGRGAVYEVVQVFELLHSDVRIEDRLIVFIEHGTARAVEHIQKYILCDGIHRRHRPAVDPVARLFDADVQKLIPSRGEFLFRDQVFVIIHRRGMHVEREAQTGAVDDAALPSRRDIIIRFRADKLFDPLHIGKDIPFVHPRDPGGGHRHDVRRRPKIGTRRRQFGEQRIPGDLVRHDFDLLRFIFGIERFHDLIHRLPVRSGKSVPEPNDRKAVDWLIGIFLAASAEARDRQRRSQYQTDRFACSSHYFSSLSLKR